MADDKSTVSSQRKGRRGGRNRHRRRKNKQPALISSLPDDILQHILSFIPIKFVIRTSALSKRWRHVWCDTPSLSFDHSPPDHLMSLTWINQTLNRYTALQMMRFHFCVFDYMNIYGSYLDEWIEFAVSRNVENLSLELKFYNNYVDGFKFPDIFYNSSSLKQLTVNLHLAYMIPTCSVSWTSLKNLSLSWCKLPDESIAKILSGCPILESLTLSFCKELSFLDLSKNPCMRTLHVSYNTVSPGPTQIVAPYIHYLKLLNSKPLCTLLDVSSLTEAKMDTFYCNMNGAVTANFLRVMVLDMLEKLRNVEKLKLGETYLQILSLAEIHGDPFPMFNVKSLTLETEISQYVIPGIRRMLQNSPELKKITLHLRTCHDIISTMDLDTYVRNLNNPDQTWKSKFCWNKKRSLVKCRHVVAFMKLMVENAEALEMLVLRFQDRYYKFKEIVPTLSNENNVSILLSFKP